jgi:hypothetical protein
MFSSPTTYRSGSRSVEVLPGESHSAAWAHITSGGPVPASYPCADDPAAGRVRRRVHRSARRPAHRRRALTPLA